MKRAPRPNVPILILLAVIAAGISCEAWAQSPLASSYAARDGRVPTTVLGCVSTDGSYTAQVCGVAGRPLHVQVDAGAGGTPTTGAGTGSAQLVGVQGGGAGALPVAVAQAGVWTLALPNGAHLALDTGGNVIGKVAQSGAWSVSVNNLPATQPVSAASLPLPTGAATAANQPAINADGGALVHITNGSTVQTVTGSVSVSNLPATQAVSAASLPLPAGAAQDGTDITSYGGGPPPMGTGGSGIRGWLSTQAQLQSYLYNQMVYGTTKVQLQAGGPAQPVSAASLPLPAGAATAGLQSPLNVDGGSQVHVMNLPATQAVSAGSLPLPAGAATAANQAAVNGDGGSQVHVMNLPAIQAVGGTVSVGNLPATQAVSAASLPLPSGAATAANQAALNGDGGSQVHVMNLPVTQPVSGAVSISNLPATQAVSATALPLPNGAATAANQPALNGDGGSQVHVMNFPGTQPVTGAISVTNLPATQPVSGSVSISNLPATQAVSAASLPLPAGAATAANQPAINGDGGGQVHLVNALPAGSNSIGTVVEANRSGAWTDASFTAGSTASTPSALAAAATRTGLHVWNVGSSTACMNYTSTAAASGSGCAAGSVPIPAGSAYLEDQPGNVSPEAISLVCAGTACPLTIKVR